MRLLSLIVLALGIVLPASVTIAKEEPRKPSAAEQRKQSKERRAKLKQRAQRAKQNAKANEALGKKIGETLDPWKDKGLCGSVLVARDGVVIFKQGYGMADRENKRANAPDTVYDIGSVTKLFTAAGILKLEMQGKLSLDDKLEKFFKFAPADKKGITLTQLLSHTSGMAREYDFEGITDAQDRDACTRHMLSFPLSSQPGSKFEYSNANYFVAGAVIEVASGVKYEDYMMKEIITPAGMKDSGFCSGPSLDDKRGAMRYENGEKKGDVTNWPFTWGQRGCGYLCATPEDMWRFSEAIDWSDVLDQSAKDKWFKVVRDGYSLGWFVPDEPGMPAKQWHGGAAPGARCYFARFPEHDAMYVLFLNDIDPAKRTELEIAAAIESVLVG
jgi:CubicO group peptidase (beta-lactamase class C family)